MCERTGKFRNRVEMGDRARECHGEGRTSTNRARAEKGMTGQVSGECKAHVTMRQDRAQDSSGRADHDRQIRTRRSMGATHWQTEQSWTARAAPGKPGQGRDRARQGSEGRGLFWSGWRHFASYLSADDLKAVSCVLSLAGHRRQ